MLTNPYMFVCIQNRSVALLARFNSLSKLPVDLFHGWLEVGTSLDHIVRGGCRPGARERSAGELESRLGWRDSQETTMGLSLGLLSRMGSVRWLPAWEEVSPGSFIGGNLRRRLSSHPPVKAAIIYRVYGSCKQYNYEMAIQFPRVRVLPACSGVFP